MIRSLVKVSLAVALTSAAAPARAQEAAAAPPAAEARPLGLRQVLESVERRFPLLLAAREEEALAKADVRSAWGAFDVSWRTRAGGTPLGGYQSLRLDSVFEQPTTLWGVTVFGGYRLGVGNFAEYDGKLATNDLGELRAGIGVPLWRNGPIDRRRANIDRAEEGQKVAKAFVAQQKLEFARSAAGRYWDWVAAGKRREVVSDLLRIAKDRDSQLASRVVKGDLAEVERLDNERAVLQRMGQLAVADRALVVSSLELGLFLRDEDGDVITPRPGDLPSELPEPGPSGAGTVAAEIQGAIARRPETLRLEAQRKQAKIELRWAENQLMPAIDLQAVVSADLGAGSDKRGKPELELGVLLDIPLQANVAGGRVDAAKAQLRRIDQQARFTRDRIATDVKDALNALDNARERVALARKEVELARALEKAEVRKLELGDGTILFVNLREQQTAEARLREVEALADYQKALAAFRAATAR